MQTKYKLPSDVRLAVYSFVKGQTRRELAFDEGRETKADKKIMEAVQQALNETGEDICNVDLQEKLQQGIWLSIIDRKKYTYRYLNLSGISSKKFYEYRNIFIYNVAKNMDYV